MQMQAGWCRILLATGASLFLVARAGVAQPSDTRAGTQTPVPLATLKDGTKTTPGNTAVSAQVAELVKMTESGVEPSVVKSYVENSTTADRPRAEEVIYLRDHGVSAEVISALIRRAGELGDQAARASQQMLNQTAQQAASAAAAASTASPQPPYASPSYIQPAPTYLESYPQYVYTSYPAYGYTAPYIYGSYYSYPGFYYSYPYLGFRGGFRNHFFPRNGFSGGGHPGGMGHSHR
jgi:hypothetical protein